MRITYDIQDGFPCKEVDFRFSFHILPKFAVGSFNDVVLAIDLAWLFWRFVVSFRRDAHED